MLNKLGRRVAYFNLKGCKMKRISQCVLLAMLVLFLGGQTSEADKRKEGSTTVPAKSVLLELNKPIKIDVGLYGRNSDGKQVNFVQLRQIQFQRDKTSRLTAEVQGEFAAIGFDSVVVATILDASGRQLAKAEKQRYVPSILITVPIGVDTPINLDFGKTSKFNNAAFVVLSVRPGGSPRRPANTRSSSGK